MDNTTAQRKQIRKETKARIAALGDVARSRKLTPAERDEANHLMRELDEVERAIATAKNFKRRNEGKAANVEGRRNENVPIGQMQTWYERAVENRVLPSQGTNRDWNRAFGEMAGFAKPTMETRTLLEDVTGSAQALSITQYLPRVIDILLPQTIMGNLNFNTIAMDREFVQMPEYTSTYAGPQWIAENGSLSLDAGPAFGPLLLSAPGGFKFYTSISLELSQDAFLQGSLDQWLAMEAARKLTVALDTSMLMGVEANVGIPGLNNESGFVIRKQTSDSGTSGLAPADTQELSVVAELAQKKYVNINELAFVANVGTHEAFERIPLATYGKYFDDPKLIANVPWVLSENSALAYTETDPSTASSVAQTGGAYSSLYCGPWSRFGYLGVRMDLASSAMRLDQRLIDQGEIGFFFMFRGSIRFAHPETYTRTIGVITK